MRWIKHGVIYCPDGSLPWARRYATCPTPAWLDDGTLRVYLQCRDGGNVGRVGYVDLDPENPLKLIRIGKRPVLGAGMPGCFDDNGVLPTSVVRVGDGRLFLYYVGFELCHRIRYRLLSGIAVSEDGGDSFRRIQPTPVLERSPTELHFRGGPFVLASGSGFRMWYVAGSRWEDIAGKPMPVYDLRYAESGDGIRWPPAGRVVLGPDPGTEHGLGRPYVVPAGNGYRMYFSVRKKHPCAYRLGYAESPDGRIWERQDGRLNLEPSAEGWDSDAVEYGAEIATAGKTWLLYNGNDFGATGLGLAERVE